jgi:hypothetical protein
MMLPSPVVFDHGPPSASIPSTSHCPSDPFNPRQSQTDFATTKQNQPFLSCLYHLSIFQIGYASTSTHPTLPVQKFHSTANHCCADKSNASSHTLSLLYQWLPPPCQTSCFFSVWTLLFFPGTSIYVSVLKKFVFGYFIKYSYIGLQ